MDSNKHEGENENVPFINLPSQIYQLQVLASELKSGFTEAMQELSRIQHGEYALEEKVKSCRCIMEEKVTEIKNSLNYVKEEVNSAMVMIQAITAKQEEMQQKIEQLQQEKRRESRKVKAKRAQKEEHGSQTGQMSHQSLQFQPSNLHEPILINQHFTHLLQTSGFEKDHRPGEATMPGLLSAGPGHIGPLFEQEQTARISAPAPRNERIKRQPFLNVKIMIMLKLFPEVLTVSRARVKLVPSTNSDAEESFKSLSADSQPRVQITSVMWRQPKDSRDWEGEHTTKDQPDQLKEVGQSRTSSFENMLSETFFSGKRQNAAADLLESERKYVLNLSLILQIKSTLQGADVKRNTKERSFFPSSLRYLTQLHVDLLQTLQERVVKWSRQGILGDIFLKLTNDENNFLDYYIAYLRDLPECISVIHIVVLKEVEEDIKSDLYVLLFHVVQRIPEYLIHLQTVLKYTEQEHPDYYLLLVCVQRLRVFIAHYNLLYQYDEDLLIQKRKKLKRSSMLKLYKGLASQGQEISPSLSTTSIRDSGIHSDDMQQLYPSTSASSSAAIKPVLQMKTSQKTPTESIQTMKTSDWELDGRKIDRSENVLVSTTFGSTDQELNSLLAPFQNIPEMEYSSAPLLGRRATERSLRTSAELLTNVNFTPGYEEFEYGAEIMGLRAPYDVETFQNRSLFENCSPASASSESSLDICFLRPINSTNESDRNDHSLQPLPRSCTSPVSSSTYRHEPLSSKNRQLSRSLKEFPRNPDPHPPRVYSTRGTSTSRQQHQMERSTQSHGKSSTTRSSQRNVHLPQRPQGESRPLLDDRHLDNNTRFFQKEHCEQTSFSAHHPSQDQKGGFRSSFRKLFRKKSSGVDNKEKAGDRSVMDPSPTKQGFFRPQTVYTSDLKRGTAV